MAQDVPVFAAILKVEFPLKSGILLSRTSRIVMQHVRDLSCSCLVSISAIRQCQPYSLAPTTLSTSSSRSSNPSALSLASTLSTTFSSTPSASSILVPSPDNFSPRSLPLTNSPCDYMHSLNTKTTISLSSTSQASTLTLRVPSSSAYEPTSDSSSSTYSSSPSSWRHPLTSTALPTGADKTVSTAGSSLSSPSECDFTFAGSSLTRPLPTASFLTIPVSTASLSTAPSSSGPTSSTTPLTSTSTLTSDAVSTAFPFSSPQYQQSTPIPSASTGPFSGFTPTASSSIIDTLTGSVPTASLLTAFSSTDSPLSADAASRTLSVFIALGPLFRPLTSPSSAEAFATSSTALSPAATLADFATVSCNSSDVGNPAVDPSVRWAEAKCDDTWSTVTHDWTAASGAQSLDFVQFVSEYWKGPQQWNCGKIGEDPCGGGPGDCGEMDVKGPIGTPNTPAGWVILQSFTNFHNVSPVSQNTPFILFSAQPTVSG